MRPIQGQLTKRYLAGSPFDSKTCSEFWSSVSAHQVSLTQEKIKALIKRNMPLIAGGERIEIVPIGSKGLLTE